MTTSICFAGGGSESERDKLKSPQQFRVFVVAGLVIANILVLILSIDALYRSRQSYEIRARTLTENIASAVDQSISSSIEKIDLALLTVVDELEQQLAQGGIDVFATNAVLARQMQRLPEAEAFRIARADGIVILGKGVNKLDPVSWSDRDYFTFLRGHPDGGLQITKPIVGRAAKQFIIGFNRRYNYPDGRFAGVISAPIALSHFSRILAQFNIGPNGSIILRDADIRLIARVPPIPNKPAGQVGNSNVSKDFREILGSGALTATYSTPSGADGFARTGTFRRLAEDRMVVIATVAKVDYLAGWNQEVYRTLAIAGSFLILSLLLGYFLLRSLKQTERNRQQLHDSDAFVHDIINSLSEHVAVIDNHGKIIKVNYAWQHFAAMNGCADSAQVSIGANYIETWDKAAGNTTEEAEAIKTAAGLRALLDESRQEFTLEYPCHSPEEDRWFSLHAVPLYGSHKGAVLIRQNITERKQWEARQQGAKTQLELQLAEISALQTLLQEQAIRDPLTGLYNRRYLNETLARELSRAKREGYPLTLVMLDLDHFKRVNDTYGHAAGDDVLIAVSKILVKGTRESDMICRYGGEEFLISLPRMSVEQTLQRVETWRIEFAETPIHFGEFSIRSTLSAGIAGYPNHCADAETLAACADAALYTSKRQGRNCVTCFESEALSANKN